MYLYINKTQNPRSPNSKISTNFKIKIFKSTKKNIKNPTYSNQELTDLWIKVRFFEAIHEMKSSPLFKKPCFVYSPSLYLLSLQYIISTITTVGFSLSRVLAVWLRGKKKTTSMRMWYINVYGSANEVVPRGVLMFILPPNLLLTGFDD